jgi:diketogulonate reductase-like aldo/keto reductase
MSKNIILQPTLIDFLGLSCIPKSTNEKRLKENFNVFDFEISEEDQRKLFDIKERKRLLILDL